MKIETLPSWPTYSETHSPGYLPLDEPHDFPDYYFTYFQDKNQLESNYLDKWFLGKSFNNEKDEIIYGSVITLKKVDEETCNHLHNDYYNPLSIEIIPTYTGYFMMVILRSLDDSSYKICFNDDKEKYTIDELYDIRYKLIDYISKKTELNGNNLLDYCVGLGAEVDSIDYN